MAIQKVTLPNGNTKWQVRFFLSGRGSTRINKRFDRRADAERYLQNLKQELHERRVNPYKVGFEDRTFAEEAENWLKSAEIRFSPGTVLKARVIVENMLPKYGDIPLSRFTAEVLTRYQQEEKAKIVKEKNKPVEDSTVNRKCQTVMAILNFAVKQRRIPFNPAQGFSKLRESQKEAKFWTREEAMSFLAFANEKYPNGAAKRSVYAVYLLALNTGLRSGEIWGLKPDDVSSVANVITISRQLNAVTGQLGPTKNRRGRIIPCSNEVKDELKSIIRQLARQGKLGRDSLMFQNEKGGAIDYKNFYHRQFIPDVRAWKGKTIRFHDLRHTATTLMIASGVDIRTVMEICGHADISTTMNYVHLVASAVQRVPQLFSLSPLGRESDEEK